MSQSNPACPLPKTNSKVGDYDAYATSDIVIPHSTKSGLWKILGRVDDQIILSNGEKVRHMFTICIYFISLTSIRLDEPDPDR